MKIVKIHSATDLITNSSTVIFTYSGGAVKPFKEMINELLKTFGVETTCEDMFDTVILCDESYPYSEWLENLEPDDYPEGVDENTNISELFEEVATGKIPKPAWFEDAESAETCCDYYTPSTYLYLIPKDEKYRKIGALIKAFLYSTDHEATRDG